MTLFALYTLAVAFAIATGITLIIDVLVYSARTPPILLRWISIGCAFLTLGLLLIVAIGSIWVGL